ncbi:uncharacterized protein ACA1_329980 [Acanthamoeba castellanii str. Neff]|uniref:Uncharacterized protein n=1 Tax=Acanthamoeba castellanii (strain ATCC 30010 / Neff) TaxID=1257118 RepID=L8GHX7_ACACF|nr:uncharacterized protein ACA1_329980 [Acanthamoeba castellanii str. Neff]ELR12464.1 hypothetical protein ACA1_329980 [Acanthamoeba castellanii str. Neff]
MAVRHGLQRARVRQILRGVLPGRGRDHALGPRLQRPRRQRPRPLGSAPDAPADSLQAGPGPLHPRRQLEHRVRQLAQAICVCAVAAGAHQRGGGQGRSPAAAGQAGRVRAPDRALLRHLLRVRHLARILRGLLPLLPLPRRLWSHRSPEPDVHSALLHGPGRANGRLPPEVLLRRRVAILYARGPQLPRHHLPHLHLRQRHEGVVGLLLHAPLPGRRRHPLLRRRPAHRPPAPTKETIIIFITTLIIFITSQEDQLVRTNTTTLTTLHTSNIFTVQQYTKHFFNILGCKCSVDVNVNDL